MNLIERNVFFDAVGAMALMTRAVFGARPNSILIALLVRLRARNSNTCPSSTRVVITAAASK